MRRFTRKDFLVLTTSTAATAALGVACGSEEPSTRADSTAGSGGTSSSSGGKGGGTSGGAAGSAGTSPSGGSAGTGGSSTSGGGGSGGSGGSGGASGGSAGTSGGSGGTGGSGGSGGSGGNSCLAAVVADITCPHDPPHELTVPVEDIVAGTPKSYDIQGQSDHSHTVSLTADDFAKLKAGETVYKFVEADQYQDHCVTLSCGTAGNPETSGMCDLGNAFTCN